MTADFQQMSPQTRVWVYQSDREFTADEAAEIQREGNLFAEAWTAHNKQLDACCLMRYNYFIILAADEARTATSGCSIDKSLHFIRHIEDTYRTSLLNRMQVAFKVNNNIHLCKLHEIRSCWEQGKLTAETIVFNNLVNTKKELDTNWEIPFKNSWHREFIGVKA